MTLAARARAWIASDPDPETRAELQQLLAAGADEALADRFAGSLAFGTAGLRGEMGAGPNRMNRATVRLAAWAFARYLNADVAGAASAGVVIGYDARHHSRDFAHESARVLAAEGIRARLLPRPLPTPVLAFAVRHLHCAGGVMVTASHNPAKDNGYKVYAADGAQIIPPVDERIAKRMAAAAPPSRIDLAEAGSPLISMLDDRLVDSYIAMAAATRRAPSTDLTIAYTPLHGVGRDVFLDVLHRTGFERTRVHVVAEQAAPDPEFPTVPFPNPEEPGALDLLVGLARSVEADIAIAHDPDADRLAVAVPHGASGGESGWRRLTGDEVGCLLAHHLLSDVTPPDDDGRRPLVVTTVVSSRLLAAIAADLGAEYAETLTGFKWLCRPAMSRSDLRPVLAYEEALGYALGTQRDKDGITAALAVAAMAAHLKGQGTTIPARLAELDARYGAHVTGQWSLRREGPDALDDLRAIMAAVRARPPRELAGRAVTNVRDLLDGGELPPTDALVFEVEGRARVVVRPSGTEPKAKVYAEAIGAERAGAKERVAQLLDAMRAVMEGEGA